MAMDEKREGDRIVVVDLDGTLAEYDGWKGEWAPIGEPICDVNGWNARDFMLALQRRGFQTIVYSSRGDVPAIVAWLQRHGIPYDAVNRSLTGFPGESAKPPAIAYVDDRAVRFAGNYQAALVRVIHLAGRASRAETTVASGELRETATAEAVDEAIELEVSPAGEASLIAAKLRELVRELHGASSREKMLLAEELQVIEDRIEENAERIVELQHDRDHWREMAERLDDEDPFSDE